MVTACFVLLKTPKHTHPRAQGVPCFWVLTLCVCVRVRVRMFVVYE